MNCNISNEPMINILPIGAFLTEINKTERHFSLCFYLGWQMKSQGLVDSAQDLIFRNSLIKLANIPIIENPFNTLPKFESLILGYAQRLFAQKNGRKIIHAAGLKKIVMFFC